MATDRKRHDNRIVAERGALLVAVPFEKDGEEMVEYSIDGDESLDETRRRAAIAMTAIGSWSEIDYDEMMDALDQIRHQSKPTPPKESFDDL